MKNKIIMMLSAAFLLTTLSAYAQVNTYAAKERIKKQDSTGFIQALEQERQKKEAKNHKITCPENDLKCVCKEDTYCKDYVLLSSISDIPWETIVENTKDITDYKTALYQKKYNIVHNIGTDRAKIIVLVFETYKLFNTQYSDFQSYLNALTDIPLMKASIITLLVDQETNLKKLSDKEKEELQNFNKMVENAPVCSPNLNVKKYNIKNFCVLDKNLEDPLILIGITKAFMRKENSGKNGSIQNKNEFNPIFFNPKIIKKQNTQPQEEETSEEGVIASL